MDRTRLRSVMMAVLILVAVVVVGCSTTESPQGQVDDIKITAEVKTKLASDVKTTSLANIEVNTTNGVVTLAGQVESAEVKQRAELVAEAVPGVARVNNNLQVDPSSLVR